MGIEQLKELENLKEAISLENSRLYRQKLDIVSNLVLAGGEDFRRFFSDNEFTIKESRFDAGQRDNFSFLAEFKSLFARLDFQLPPNPLCGAVYKYDLEINLGEKKKYTLLINPVGSCGPRVISHIHTNNEDTTAQKIIAAKAELEHLQAQPSANKEDFAFFIHEDGKKVDYKISYSSMYELLKVLIK